MLGEKSAARAFQAEKRRSLDALVARHAPQTMPSIILDGYQIGGGYAAQRIRFEVSRNLQIPGVLLRKPGHSRYKTIIVLEKRRGASPEATALLEHGYALMLLDVRGTGEADWGGGRTSNWASFVGRTPIGMWAEDVSKVTTYLLRRSDVEAIAILAGCGKSQNILAWACDLRVSANV
jgi:hypothetical protein